MLAGCRTILNGRRDKRGPHEGARQAFFLGVFVMACAFPPFINSIDNPRVATLHGLDVFRLLVAGSLFGFGLALLISALIIFRSE